MHVRTIPIVAAFALVLGCGVMPRGSAVIPGPLPPTNSDVARQAVMKALVDLDIPDGAGAETGYSLTGPPGSSEVAGNLVPEFLNDTGYRAATAGSSGMTVTFVIERLNVRLAPGGRDEDGAKLTKRTAEAAVSATLTGSDGGRKVYRGTGSIEDAFPRSLEDAAGGDEPFVSRHEGVMRYMKPFVMGSALTVLVWYLYSYRG